MMARVYVNQNNPKPQESHRNLLTLGKFIKSDTKCHVIIEIEKMRKHLVIRWCWGSFGEPVAPGEVTQNVMIELSS